MKNPQVPPIIAKYQTPRSSIGLSYPYYQLKHPGFHYICCYIYYETTFNNFQFFLHYFVISLHYLKMHLKEFKIILECSIMRMGDTI